MHYRSCFAFLTAAVLVSSCATPVVTLRHPKTKQVATCGGGMEGAAIGGMIGYSIQQDNDAKCVENYQKLGFNIVSLTH